MFASVLCVDRSWPAPGWAASIAWWKKVGMMIVRRQIRRLFLETLLLRYGDDSVCLAMRCLVFKMEINRSESNL